MEALAHAIARPHPVLWMAFDGLAAWAAIALAYEWSPRVNPQFEIPASHYFVLPVAVVLCGQALGLYDRDSLQRLPKIIARVVLVAIASQVALAMFSVLVLYRPVGRFIHLISLGLFGGAGLIARSATYMLALRFRTRVALIGSPEECAESLHYLRGHNDWFRYLGHCGLDETPERLGEFENIVSVCREKRPHLLLIAPSLESSPKVLDKCFEALPYGCAMMDEATFFERAFERVLIERVDPSWFYRAQLASHGDIQSSVKRIMDIVVALIGLIITAFLFPILFLLVKATSRGPAIYRQTRVGRYGRRFTLLKFRTMSADAEQNGAQWAEKDDPRITPVGRFLRKTRLDELLQFWNILKGDMSLVGPRPERPEMVERIEKAVPYFPFRNWAKPGLTGLAQIRHRYTSSVDDAREKLQYDLYYIKNWSIFLDIQILLRTISAVMKGSQ